MRQSVFSEEARRDIDVIRGAIVGEHAALAVADLAARGGQLDLFDEVVGALAKVVLAGQDLELPQTAGEDQERAGDHELRPVEPSRRRLGALGARRGHGRHEPGMRKVRGSGASLRSMRRRKRNRSGATITAVMSALAGTWRSADSASPSYIGDATATTSAPWPSATANATTISCHTRLTIKRLAAARASSMTMTKLSACRPRGAPDIRSVK